jgi:hypothetical protein
MLKRKMPGNVICKYQLKEEMEETQMFVFTALIQAL